MPPLKNFANHPLGNRTSLSLIIPLVAGIILSTVVGFAAEHSTLWGERGEKWNPRSRLPDFSFAGYHRGEQPLPNVPPGVSVKDLGAKGDGVTDDTQAFLATIARVERGAIEVPPGRYRITGFLEITRSGVVLRGAGPDKTVLVCPTPLNDIKPNWGATTTGQRTSNYSWSGGVIVVRGKFGSEVLADISGNVSRGENTVTVGSVDKLRVGQEVEVYQSDLPDNSLAVHLYSGDAGPVENLKGRHSSAASRGSMETT